MNNKNLEKLLKEYKSQLTEQENIILDIAIEHLGSSFDITKSIGFIEWKKKITHNKNNK